MRGNSWLTQKLLDSRDGLCFVELVIVTLFQQNIKYTLNLMGATPLCLTLKRYTACFKKDEPVSNNYI